MATPEYEQTGSTSGQRLAALGAKKPDRTPPAPKMGEGFVTGLLDRIPKTAEAVKTMRGPRQPSAEEKYGDLSEAELTRALRQLSGAEHTMDTGAAASLSDLLRS